MIGVLINLGGGDSFHNVYVHQNMTLCAVTISHNFVNYTSIKQEKKKNFIIIIIFKIYLFIYFWLCWVLASVRGLSPAAASGGHS